MSIGGKSQENVVEAGIGAEEITDPEGRPGFRYHLLDPKTQKKTKFIDQMWSRYMGNSSPMLCWFLDNTCDHAIEVRLEFAGVGGPGPPPVAPTSAQRHIPAGQTGFFLARVVSTAWPSWPGGSKHYPYALEVRQAGSNEVWQKLDPQLVLERPYGSAGYTAAFVAGLVVGAAAVYLLSGLFG